ncbi:MAG: sigma-70 family RNA polymerase sigma factor [Planctomycetes bacterium]|nr:sigma-70 family RNA polymerase sigma factor [Planctomycetota bacterium]
MSNDDPNTITRLLHDAGQDQPDAREQLWLRINEQLRDLASRKLAGERPDHTLQSTALVNEVYLRLFGGKPVSWNNRAHFFASASRSMEQILVDWARKRARLKRGGDCDRVGLDEGMVRFHHDPTEVLAVHEALERLERRDGRKAAVVRLRYFGGLTVEEVAEILEVSTRLVKLDWSVARAWLHREITNGAPSA